MFQVEGAVSREREGAGSSGELEVECLGCRVRGRWACIFSSRENGLPYTLKTAGGALHTGQWQTQIGSGGRSLWKLTKFKAWRGQETRLGVLVAE